MTSEANPQGSISGAGTDGPGAWTPASGHAAEPASEAFEELADRYRLLAESARDIVLMLEADGTIMFGNDAAERAYGYASRDLVGRNIRDLRAADTIDDVPGQMERAGDRGVLFETWHVRRDGTTFPVEVSSRGVEYRGQRLLLSHIRDITARHEREAERDALMAELAVANSRLDALLRIVSSTVGSVEVDELLHEVTRVVRSVTGADAAFVFTADGDRLVCTAQSGGVPFIEEGFELEARSGFAGRVAAALKPVFVADVAQSDFALPVHREFEMRSMLGVPLIEGGRLAGILEVAWHSVREVSEADQAMLQLAADQVVHAMEGARRFELTRRAERLNASLYEVTSLINSSLELSGTMGHALELAARLIGCQVGLVAAFSNAAFEILFAYGDEPGRRLSAPFMTGTVRLDAAGPAPSLIGPEDPESAWLRTELGLEEAVIAPVRVRGEWLGLLLFGRVAPGIGFDDLTIDFVRQLSGAIALAYANFSDFETEHRIAETLQEALLRLPEHVEGVEFAKLYSSATIAARVGGDFFDIFETADGRVGVLIGDVSGKGLEAAVLTSVIKDTVRAYAHDAASPADALRKANIVLRTASRLPDFASVLYVVLDPESGCGTYCCAGHPPALVLREGGGVDLLRGSSPVIGAFADLEYEESVFVLDRRDVLVLYTDGLTDVRDADRAFFGEEGVVACARELVGEPLETVPQRFYEAIVAFSGGRLPDDVALMAVRLASAGRDASSCDGDGTIDPHAGSARDRVR